MLRYLSTLPAFLAWWSTGLALLLSFAALYVLITPQRELRLIAGGNLAAAMCLCGALVGMALPVASAMAHGVDLVDLAVWGFVALFVQLAVLGLLRLAVRGLTAYIEADNRAVALLVATLCAVAGLIDAAAMSW